MDLYQGIAIAAGAGCLVKATDYLVDSRRHEKDLETGYWLACAYGLLLGLLIAKTEAATVYMAAIIGSVLAGKIDAREHAVALVCTALFVVFMGFFSFSAVLFAAFLVAAFLDEKGYFGGARFLLDLAAVIAGALGFGWASAIYIIAFDAGYIGVSQLLGKDGKKAHGRKI